VPLVQRPDFHGFRIRQELQQPIVLNFISRRIMFRFSNQPAIARNILLMNVGFHFDLKLRAKGNHARAIERCRATRAIDKGIKGAGTLLSPCIAFSLKQICELSRLATHRALPSLDNQGLRSFSSRLASASWQCACDFRGRHHAATPGMSLQVSLPYWRPCVR
jgi:hypothetical protein